MAFHKASPTRDLEDLSLSDLIAGMIDTDNSQIKKDSFKLSLSGIDSNIDPSVLIKTPDFVLKPVVDQSVAPTSEIKILSSKLGKISFLPTIIRKTTKAL